MAPGDQFLEHLAQHLRVDGNLDVKGRGLHHREVKAVEKASQHLLNGSVGNRDVVAPVQLRLLKQPAVKERNVADVGVHRRVVAHQVEGLRVVQPGEEKGVQPVAVEVGLRTVGLIVLPQCLEVVGIPTETKPPLPGQEVDEHQPVEQRLDEDPLVLVLPVGKTGNRSHRVLKYALVLAEKLLGYRLNVEGVVQHCADDALVPVVPEDAGDLLHSGTAGQVALHHHAAEGGPGRPRTWAG